MPLDDNMDIDERRKYLSRMKRRYDRAKSKAERGQLLDEMEQVTGMHRHSLIRLLASDLERHPRTKQRGPAYSPALQGIVRIVADSFDNICAERIFPDLSKRANSLAEFGEITLTPEARDQLQGMSLSTFRRTIQDLHKDEPRLPRRRPQPANLVAATIPAGRIAWEESEPGHFEVDVTHHCGMHTSGDYVHTLNLVDVATGWSEPVVVLGRSYLVMKDAFCQIAQRCPIPVRELHPDNGAEFLNDHLVRFWKRWLPDLHLSRSRPFRKDDNRFVEERNYSLIRRYLGYDRLDSVIQAQAANELCDKLWLFHNFFQPVMRQCEKTYVVAEDGTRKVKRCHDEAKTPFERLCASGVLPAATCTALTRLRDETNPLQLLREIRALTTHIFALPGARPGQSEDVAETLRFPITYEPPKDQRSVWATGTAVAHTSQAPAEPQPTRHNGKKNHRKEEAPSVTLSFERTISVQ